MNLLPDSAIPCRTAHIMLNRLSTLKPASLVFNSQSASSLLRRSFATTQLTSFDERWKKLTQAEKDLVAKEYEHLQKGDWKSLTIDQKRIRNYALRI